MKSLLSISALLANNDCRITGLYRYAVKGLGADGLTRVTLESPGETFPDDRRFALLLQQNQAKFDQDSPEWLHKENFLCAFSDANFMSKFRSSYRIVHAHGLSHAEPCDSLTTNPSQSTQRILSIQDRATMEKLLGPIDLATKEGRNMLGKFFSIKSGKQVTCVASTEKQHGHQFGNTSSGVKARGDTRTIHIINAETVKDLSAKINLTLNPTRFRPNVVVSGLKPWAEFGWVGRSIQIGNSKLSVIKQTVRCEGISVDPLDPDTVLDIPGILVKEFPEYGPYFGVYAVVDEPGTMSVGDTVVF